MVFTVVITCLVTSIYATDPLPEDSGGGTPKITMKVKSKKIGETDQIILECWGYNFKDMQGMDIAFTYNKEKLTPSNVSTNEPIEG